ncbi:hypothetical protein [Clostridium estertheticum]|nr:hypothetical protein [Clostridium estertheticum]
MKCTLKNLAITDGYSDLQNKTTNATVPCSQVRTAAVMIFCKTT